MTVQMARRIPQQGAFLSAVVLHKEPSQVLWSRLQSSLFFQPFRRTKEFPSLLYFSAVYITKGRLICSNGRMLVTLRLALRASVGRFWAV